MDDEWLQSAQPGSRLDRRDCAGRQVGYGSGNGLYVGRRGAATSAHDVQESAFAELTEDRGHLLGRLIVLTEFVGEAGVGMATDAGVADSGQLLYVWAQILGTQSAVQSNGHQAGVIDRVPEGFGSLARESPPASVGDRSGDPDWCIETAVSQHITNGKEGGPTVERVEYGLDQQQIHASIEQCLGLLGIRRDQLVKCYVAEIGIVHVRRDRGRSVSGPQAAGDEARSVSVCGGEFVGHSAGDPGGGEIDVADGLLQAIVRLRDCRTVESVGLDDIGAGFEVRPMDGLDYVRPCDGE